MDTSEHPRVAREAALTWWSSPSPTGETADAVVAALESAGLLCTRAEREALTALMGWVDSDPRQWFEEADFDGASEKWKRVRRATRALMAERASAPATAPEPAKKEQHGSASPDNASLNESLRAQKEAMEATREVMRPDHWLEQCRKLDVCLKAAHARIASLESALAEERAKPKQGDVKFEVETRTNPRRANVREYKMQWNHVGLVAEYHDQNGESHAREHAAKLTAEQGGVA